MLAHFCCSAPSPEALLEALLARKLTWAMLFAAGKHQAQKWVRDKLKPKESLLAAMGAEDHGFMVCHAQQARMHSVLFAKVAQGLSSVVQSTLIYVESKTLSAKLWLFHHKWSAGLSFLRLLIGKLLA